MSNLLTKVAGDDELGIHSRSPLGSRPNHRAGRSASAANRHDFKPTSQRQISRPSLWYEAARLCALDAGKSLPTPQMSEAAVSRPPGGPKDSCEETECF